MSKMSSGHHPVQYTWLIYHNTWELQDSSLLLSPQYLLSFRLWPGRITMKASSTSPRKFAFIGRKDVKIFLIQRTVVVFVIHSAIFISHQLPTVPQLTMLHQSPSPLHAKLSAWFWATLLLVTTPVVHSCIWKPCPVHFPKEPVKTKQT